MHTGLLLVVMSLAAYRITRLITKDSFPPVVWVRDRLVGGWREVQDGERVEARHVMDIDGVAHVYVHRKRWSPGWFAELLSCPWCASGWVSLGITACTALTVGVPAPVLVWPAVWAAGALLAAQDWS